MCILPMEGWDGTTTGGISEEMKRRWERFGASGAKLICGAEAMAVRRQGGIFRMQKGYDHSYFFVSTFIEDHIGFHAAALYD